MLKLNRKAANLIRSNLGAEIYNTWYQASNIEPCFKIEDGSVVVRAMDRELVVDRNLECLLRSLCLFSYCPLWYFKNSMRYRELDPGDAWLYDMMALNLVYTENMTNGTFLRPTSYLYKLFKLPQKKYKDIPYNMLTHDMSKFDIYYHCILGDQDTVNSVIKERNAGDLTYAPDSLCYARKSEDYEVVKLLDGAPDVPDADSPLLAIDESDIKVHKNNVEKITAVESLIISDMKKGERETYELTHHDALFATALNSAQQITLQFPDLIVPVKRNADLSPNTIAIEVEITPKLQSHYIENVAKYRNNLKYGAVIWFVNSMKTRARIYAAYKKCGGTGYTKTYVVNYVTPREYSMSLRNIEGRRC